MKRHHESVEAEQLALLWHKVGFALSAASVILAVGGVFWHRWACAQHNEALRAMGYNRA